MIAGSAQFFVIARQKGPAAASLRNAGARSGPSADTLLMLSYTSLAGGASMANFFAELKCRHDRHARGWPDLCHAVGTRDFVCE